MNLSMTAVEIWLVRCAVGGGAVLLLGYLLLRLARQPALKQRLGELGLSAALAVSVLSLLPAWLVVSWGEVEAPAREIVSAQPLANEKEAEVLVFVPEMPRDAIPEAKDPVSVIAEKPVAAAAPLESAEPVAFSWEGFRPFLIAAYVFGAGYFLVRLVWAVVTLATLVRRCEAVPEWVRQCLAERYPGRQPRLLMSARLRFPLSFGLFRPTIVLPARLCDGGSADQLEWVLAHEMTHLRRRDSWSGLLGSVVQALYFYVPWCWWIRRQVRLCQEFVADAASARPENKPDYAEFLLTLSRTANVPALSASVSGPSSELFRRIRMLLEKPVIERGYRWWLCAAAVSLFGLAVLVSGFGIRPASAQGVIVLQEDEKKPNGTESKGQLFRLLIVPDPQGGGEKKKFILKKVEPGIELDFDVVIPRVAPVQVPKVKLPLPPQGKGGFRFVPEPEGTGLRLEGGPGHPPGMDEAAWNDLQNALKKLEKANGLKEIEAARQEIEKAVSKLRHQPLQFRFPVVADQLLLKDLESGWKTTGQGRLGVEVEPPGSALVEQLGLPKDLGLVIVNVREGSPADKAGLRKNDILLEVDARGVPSDNTKLMQMLADIKANKPFDVMVLRKGQKETIKGVTLPGQPEAGVFKLKLMDDNWGGPGALQLPVFPNAKDGIMMTTFRNSDKFTSRYQEGSLIITVLGKVDKGDSVVTQITVQDGAQSNEYASVEKVPPQYRDKVDHVIQMIRTGRIEIQNPK
jgi:Zn-dependent protease with chaperone function